MAASIPAHRTDTPRAAVLYALPDERRYFGSDYHSLRILRAQGGGQVKSGPGNRPDDRAHPYSLCIGVGPENALRNTALLLESGRSISAILVAGFAGGLSAVLKPGCIVVSDMVVDPASLNERPADPDLLVAAAKVSVPEVRVARGRLAAVDHVLVHAGEKRELARTTRAIAVDMELNGASAAAARFGVPWLAVRVITDGVEDDLPFDFNASEFQASTNPDGGVDRGRVVASALMHPWKIPALVRLGTRTSLASRNLALFLRALLEVLP